jgi:hypothetical protein
MIFWFQPRTGLRAFCFLLCLTGCDIKEGTGTSSTQGSQAPDPVVVDAPIAYIERPLPKQNNGSLKPDNILMPTEFNPGARLIVKARATSAAPEIAVTEAIFPPTTGMDGSPVPQAYDVKDPSPSRDGKKLLFALRAPRLMNQPEELQPTWDIWEYDRISNTARRIISSDEEAQKGHEVQPAYLPDGRIVFSSDRQTLTRQQILDRNGAAYRQAAEGTDLYSFQLHVMDSDGGNLQQLTHNPALDLYPRALPNGDVLFMRWDRQGGNNSLSFYTLKPDGSQISFHFGYHSQNAGTQGRAATFFNPVVQDDGKLVASLRPRTNSRLGGDLVTLDIANHYEIDQAINGGTGTGLVSITKGTAYSEPLGAEGAAPDASPAGYFQAAYPMNDNLQRYLVSWSPCRRIDPVTQKPYPCTAALASQPEAPPSYALWMYNSSSNTQLPVKLPPLDVQIQTPVILLEKPLLPLSAGRLDTGLATANLAVLHIHNVNDLGLGTYAGATGIRLVRPVPLPKDDDLPLIDGAFGVGGRGLGMRDILAYAPLETDGSVKMQVPAQTPFSLELVNAAGQRLGPRHQNWLSLAPGETRDCKGCHQANDKSAPHGRLAAEPLPGTPSIASSLPVRLPVRVPALGPGTGHYGQLQTQLQSLSANCPPLETPIQWTPPVNNLDCLTQWTASCATTINYLEHIQPLWQADRRQCDSQKQLLKDNTCLRCHDRTALSRLQAAGGSDLAISELLLSNTQLDLRGSKKADADRYVIAYTQLFTRVNEETYEKQADGSYLSIEKLYEETQLETQPDGTQVPVIRQVPRALPLRLDTGGARSGLGQGFFNRFNNPADTTHYQSLSAEELRLIGEWLDLGAQYYNEPSKARDEN